MKFSIQFNKSLIIRLTILCFILTLLCAVVVLLCNWFVEAEGEKGIVPPQSAAKADAIIVPGSLVFSNGRVSDVVADRLITAAELYKSGVSNRILVTGDHGTRQYDEVNTMRRYLEQKGIPSDSIFMDHAGFNTYDSIYRARDVFCVKNAVVVTQRYHLVRALYIAKCLGLNAQGVASDRNVYYGMNMFLLRDAFSRTKAVLQAGIFKPKPKFLGDTLPIFGNGVVTHD